MEELRSEPEQTRTLQATAQMRPLWRTSTNFVWSSSALSSFLVEMMRLVRSYLFDRGVLHFQIEDQPVVHVFLNVEWKIRAIDLPIIGVADLDGNVCACIVCWMDIEFRAGRETSSRIEFQG